MSLSIKLINSKYYYTSIGCKNDITNYDLQSIEVGNRIFKSIETYYSISNINSIIFNNRNEFIINHNNDKELIFNLNKLCNNKKSYCLLIEYILMNIHDYINTKDQLYYDLIYITLERLLFY